VESHIEPGAKLRDPKGMQKILEEYSKAIGPWAERQAKKLIDTIQNANKRSYAQTSKAMGLAMKADVGEANVGAVARALQNEQVALIKSIPTEAGLRAQKIAMEAVLEGRRALPDQDTITQLEQQLGLSKKVAESRAKLIAVTETARANASMTQARAVAVGAVGYIWRATMDEATRKSHAEMNGKFVSYTEQPKLSDGTKGHAGTFPNCRCWQDPVFNDES
jgi:phage putative head morphogenesis protein, SPP1 gp7 family